MIGVAQMIVFVTLYYLVLISCLVIAFHSLCKNTLPSPLHYPGHSNIRKKLILLVDNNFQLLTNRDVWIDSLFYFQFFIE